MKKLMLILGLLLTLSYTACSVETIEEELTEEVVDPDITDPDPDPDPDPDVTSNTPCATNILSGVESGATIDIDCLLDLEGKTINLPSNVTLNFAGGDVYNGTIEFGADGKIDGKLMSSKLALKGTVMLKDPIFKFVTSRWEIVEGPVNDEIAKKNKEILQDMILCIKDFGGSTFEIDKLDAYFKVDVPLSVAVPQLAAITLPSDFNLIMSDNTHLRMQPNGFKQPTLLSVTNGRSNVLIQGGYLHGERDEHDYSSGGTHEWAHLLRLKGCSYVTVKNVTFMDAAGDGIDVSGLGHSFESNYTPSHHLTITNNTFIRNRRNNLSVTDGNNLVIEENEFIDAGIHTAKSQGTAPGFAIDVEAVRGTGSQPYQIAEDIIIRNNIERGSRVGGFTVHTGDRVTIEGNQMETSISYSTSIGTIIRNNTLTISNNDSSASNRTAITAGRNDRYERNYGNKVYGNTITGFSTGIKVANTDLEVYENKIIDCKVSLTLEVLTKSKIYKNEIKSSKASSDGILSAGQSKYLDDVVISDNIIDVTRTPIQFVNINNDSGEENYQFTITNNDIMNGNATISDTHGFIFSNNSSPNGGVRLVKAKRGEVSSNLIEPDASHGVRIDSGCRDLKIISNDIDVSGNYNCIQESPDGINITISNNTCS